MEYYCIFIALYYNKLIVQGTLIYVTLEVELLQYCAIVTSLYVVSIYDTIRFETVFM